jgi:hypothetical protein
VPTLEEDDWPSCHHNKDQQDDERLGHVLLHNRSVELQAVLELHRSSVAFHHLDRLPTPEAHDVQAVDSTFGKDAGKRPSQRVRVAG